MKTSLFALLLSLIMAVFSACSGQNQAAAESISPPVNQLRGDTAAEIGKNIDYMLQDNEGKFWFATNGDGVYSYDGNKLIHYTTKHGLCSNFVQYMQLDMNGNLWFSTRDGICQFDGQLFTDYTDRIKNAGAGKLRYRKGGLFFGHLNGMCFFDGNTFTNFVIHPETYKPSPTDLSRPYAVYSSVADHSGTIWFGTQSKGVCKYDGKTFSFVTGKNLDGPAVRTIFEDKNGILWFGNNGGGLFRYDGEKLSNVTDEHNLGNPGFLRGEYGDKPGSLARIWTINEDKQGKLWIGTIDAGLWKYDGNTLSNYTINDGLGGNSIWFSYKDKAGDLWFVTNGDAIYKLSGTSFTKLDFHK